MDLAGLLILVLGQVGGDPTALPLPSAAPPPAVAPAPVPSRLSLDDLQRIAARHNPTLAQAVDRIGQARGTADQAGRYPNPFLIWNASSLGDEGTVGTQQGYLQQPIVLGGKLRFNRERYEVDVEIARWRLVEQQYRVLNGVRLRYFQVLAQQQALELRAGLARMAEDVVSATREKVETDHASEADLLMAENDAAEMHLDLDQLRERYRNTWREFGAFLGVPDLPPVPLDGRLELDDVPDLDWGAILARLLCESPEVRVAELQIRRAELTLRRERAGAVPDVVARAGAGHDPTSDQTTGYVRLYVEAPIWDRNQGNIASAQHALLDVRRELDRVRYSLQQRLARDYNHYQTSRDNILRYRGSILPRARRAFELYSRSFRDEDASFSRVQSSRSAYAQTYIKYLEELLELHRAEVSIGGFLLIEEDVEAGSLRPPSGGLPRAPAGGGAPVTGRPSRTVSP